MLVNIIPSSSFPKKTRLRSPNQRILIVIDFQEFLAILNLDQSFEVCKTTATFSEAYGSEESIVRDPVPLVKYLVVVKSLFLQT